MAADEAPDDADVWESLARQYDSLRHASSEQHRSEIRAGVRRIARVFGRAFVPSADRSHPLVSRYIHVLMPWTPSWMQHFCDCIDAMRQCRGAENLLRRLGNPKTWDDTLAELEAAAAFQASGNEVEIEPRTQVGKKRRKPDFRVQIPSVDDWLFVEVSRLKESRRDKRAMQSMEDVLSLVRLGGAAYGGILHKQLATSHARELARQVKEAAARAVEQDELVELVKPGVIEMAFAPRREMLDRWCKDRAMPTGNFRGPRLDPDPVLRVGSRIEDEAKQIPSGSCGLVVIATEGAFFLRTSLEDIANELEEAVFRRSRLVGAVVGGAFQGVSKPKTVTLREHEFVQHLRFGRLAQQRLLLRNRYPNAQPSEAMWAAIRKAMLEVY